jgi:metal-sulfur cluster biosynthetic enzyme
MVEAEAVREALRSVEDPELELSLVGLGLIYDIKLEEKNGKTHCEIDMTLTSPGCPVAPEIMAAVHRAALTVEGVEDVQINLVWSPRWDAKIHADDDTKFEMGIYD